MKKLISLSLVIAMILSFTACSGGTTETPKDTTSPTETTAPQDTIVYEEDALPKLDFEGTEISILATDNVKYYGCDVSVEELNSEPVNDSIYNRELFVEDRLGVEINAVKILRDDFMTEANKQLNSFDDTYHIYSYITYAMSAMVFDGSLVNLRDVEYLDLEKPWWAQKFNYAASIDGELYQATGSITTSLHRSLFAVFYNTKLAEDYSDSKPELSNLYDLVNSSKWTYDKFYELGSDIYRDLNGNSESDADDFYGIGFRAQIPTDAIYSAFDITILSPTSDGWFELALNTDKFYSALEMINNTLHNTTGCFSSTEYTNEDFDNKFASGNLLFNISRLVAVESTGLRNMTDDYGILPYPKYDEAQSEYYSFAHDQYISFGIPVTNTDPDVSGAVLEALASYSYRETEPIYLDMALKGKYMNDAESRMMIDIIVDGFKVDTAWIYPATLAANFGGSFRDKLESGSGDYASSYTKIQKNIKVCLMAYKKTFDELK